MDMSAQESDIGEAARLWAIRIQDPAFADWDGFTAWLERDPAHLAAYEAVLEADEWAADLFASEPQAPPLSAPAPAPRQRRNWFAVAGMAAAAVAVAGGWAVLDRDSPAVNILTAPGEHRTINLADGSSMMLNGGTRITIDPDTPRQIALAQGEALFQVKHDADKPFVVTVGKTRLLDAGTVFNVVRDGKAVDVAVAEGAVIYEPGPNQIRLAAGDELFRAHPGATPVLRRANPQAIGGWRTGQLQYNDASLDRVARDLARNIGHPIEASGGAERMRFTGTLMLQGSPDQILARAGPLLGVSFAPKGETWTMTPDDDGRR